MSPTSLPRHPANAPRSRRSDGRHPFLALGRGHTHRTRNSAEIPTGTCEADPFPDPRGSMCFAQADGQRNLGRDPVHQRMENHGGEGNCKGVANRLRKIRRVPAERIPLTPCPEHAKPRSNASFETKHHPPAAFRELPSFTKRRPMNATLRKQKSREMTRVSPGHQLLPTDHHAAL